MRFGADVLAEAPYKYDLFGLTISSEIELPELIPAFGTGGGDVLVTTGTVDAPENASGLSISGNDAMLVIPGVGRFLARDGRTLIVDSLPGVADRNLRLYLLGSAIAAIIHQRGLLPLHANAIVIDGHVIGFMGHPGAGKSTLAAWFHDQGYDVLADDVCVVTQPDPRTAMAYPGIPRLRLWREALEASGRDATIYDRAFDDMDKYTVPTGASCGVEPHILSHLYLLDKTEGTDQTISPMVGAAAVEALVANTYRGAYVPLMGRTRQHLFACAQLAGAVPVFSARRRWGYDAFEIESTSLARHARAFIQDRVAG